ncbi:hypothetical protein Q4Q39_08680 [Flavivirga amylovorans]|uniref:ABM domain-containing protein n=1 Tax=Flavivirga amylovorans TaxID=870486 RepID=A0ABT8X0J4_9FLAO|nr:hypothetical protein [Flavivirga amylovorans]MDO5987469.1 hypothetical protein [Flavivirga amylovorans]
MKTTNRIFATVLTMLLLLSPTIIFAQEEEAPERPEFIAVTTMHWNMDMEDFDMDTWKAIEKEFLEKVTMKNEFILGASTYLHLFTADNTELIYVQTFASWEDMGKFGARNAELIKEAWPDEAEREAFSKKRMAYYAHEHSDEIYAPMPGVKLMTEKPTKDMVTYVRKNHFSFPEDGTQEEFMALKKEGFDAVISKNEHIKAYYPHVHAWGSDRTEYLEAFFLDSMADLDKMYDRNAELMKEAFPDEEARKAKGKAWNNYFTGVHGDYLYTWVHDLSK